MEITQELLTSKIYGIEQLVRLRSIWKMKRQTVAFTNGCFDILHAGHIYSLVQAASQASHLIVGLNSDESVRRLKGPERPIQDEKSRALILSSLCMIEAVIIFREDTPEKIIEALRPDFLIKGGDYKIEEIAGAQSVIKNGGKVIINKIIEGFSTTLIAEKLKKG